MSVNKKASPREKLARNATDEGSREAAWNKCYRNAERKDLIHRLRGPPSPRGRLKISLAPIRTVEDACAYKWFMTVIGIYRLMSVNKKGFS